MQNKELAKKILHLVAGAASVSKQKLESLVEDFIEKAEMTEEEGKKLFHEISEKSKEAKEEFENRLEEAVKKALAKMHIATHEDVKSLENRISNLEKQAAQAQSEARSTSV